MTVSESTLPQNTKHLEPEQTYGSVITEDDRSVYLLVSKEKREIDRLVKQAQVITEVKGGYFDAPVQEQLKQGINVLDSGCGPGYWILRMSEQYPKSTFYGIDISPTFESGSDVVANRPKNCRFLLHNLLEPMLFPDNSFDFINQQFLAAAIPEKSWQSLLKELLRVLKPGGWIEITEVVGTDIVNAGPKHGVLNRSIRDGGLEKGIRYSVGRELEGHLIESGAINIDVKPMSFPLGHGGAIGDFWSKNVMQLFRDQLRWMVLKRNPELEDALAFEEFLLEVVEECKTYRSSMLIYRYYAQKPYDV